MILQTETGGSAIWTRSRRFGVERLSATALALLLSASLALAVTIYFQGRTDPLHATRVWLGALVVSALPPAFWLLKLNSRLSRLSTSRRDKAANLSLLLSLLLFIAVVSLDAALYLSDGFHHTFTSEWVFRRGIAIGAVASIYVAALLLETTLSWAHSGRSYRTALVSQVRSHGEAMAILAVTGIGILLGSSYITVMGDDYARYWTIADALGGGLGYPASEVGQGYQAGGMSRYLVDLPGLPLAMLLSFTLMGHTVLAAMAPTIIAASLFPTLAYLAFRELTRSVALSYVLSVILTTFPLLAFYVLRAAEPDGMFVALLMALAFLAIRCDNGPDATRSWLALGFVAGLVALTRPEGVMYVGVTFATLLLRYRAHRGLWLAVGPAASMIAAFSLCMLLTFGAPWPGSFVGTVQGQHVAQNLEGFLASALPNYAGALGVSEAVLGLAAIGVAVLYAVGAWQLARHRPQLLFLALLPAASIVLFLLVSPALTRPELPYDYFRRASYGLPYLALVVSLPLARALATSPAGKARVLAISILLAISVMAVSYENGLGARPELIYEGGTQILTSGRYILATDLLAHPYDLPRLPYERSDGVLQLESSFDYMAFRTALNGFFAPLDLHGSDRARDYAPASLVIFLVGLGYALLARRCRCPGETVKNPR